MGQYWKIVNLDKKQYLDPWNLGTGAKLWEQLANAVSGRALIVLLAPMPVRRGGGDLQPDPIIGSWAGDRIVMAGDYSEDQDLPGCPVPFGELYRMATDDYTDISGAVKMVIDRELES